MYESFYLRAVSVDEPIGAWIRYTVNKRPHAPPQGSLWCTVFDASRGAPFMHKHTTAVLAAPADAWIEIGAGCFLNRTVMIAAQESVTIGDHTMFANGCFVGDAEHRYDDPERPITWQGFTTKGPVKIGANCWFGISCAVTSGVSVGERCVIGANSVVTRDVEAGTIAAGAPAKPIRRIDFAAPGG